MASPGDVNSNVAPCYEDDLVTLWHGDCRQVMSALGEASVDAIVTDPPYGLGFMGKAWDADFMRHTTEQRRKYSGDPSGGTGPNGGYRSAASEAGRYDLSLSSNQGFQLWCEEWAQEAHRILKPGGYLLAFGGTRTWHRLACAIEDAGFEIRDSIAWMYGSGFPKSLDVSKAIDKASGASRQVLATDQNFGVSKAADGKQAYGDYAGQWDITAPATPAAQRWQGWGTALKPAFEPIVVARKPLIGTVAENVLAHGTGALNIDACRIGYASDADKEQALSGDAFKRKDTSDKGWSRPWMNDVERIERMNREAKERAQAGRWPANVILDESQAAELDKQGGDDVGYGSSGGASRFFYTAKANSSERPRVDGVAHPTVKPLDLMRYLVRLVTPPGGTVLDPFAGSGTTLEACVIEGFQAIGIELTEDYLPLIRQRLSKPIEQVLL